MVKSGERIEDHLHVMLDDRWSAYRKNLKRCRKSCSEESVHDLRVATRRLIAAIDILTTILPDGTLKSARRKLKKVLTACGALRDTHIQILSVGKMLPLHPLLQPFLTMLMLRERQLAKRVAEKVRRTRIGRMKKEVRETKNILKDLSEGPGWGSINQAVIERTVGASFAKVRALRLRVNPDDVSTIHALRVAFKKFRYMVEALQPLLPAVTEEQMEAMNVYQMRMGDIQDMEVLAAGVNGYALRRKKVFHESMLPVHQELARRRSELVDAFMKSADEVFDFLPSPPAVGTDPQTAAAS